MTKKDVINSLICEYRFSKDEKEILLFLSEHKADVEKLLKFTSVSNGRIYKVLSGLVHKGIIVKTGFKPSVYSMVPFEECIQNYLDLNLKESISAQNKVMECLAGMEDKPTAEIVYGTKKDFDVEIISMFNACRKVRILHKQEGVPWFLYAFMAEKQFFEIRQNMAKGRLVGSSIEKFDLIQKRDAYLKLYKEKQVEQLMSSVTLKKYLEESKIDIKNLKEDLKIHKNMSIFVTEYLNNPFSVYVTDKQVLMPIFTSKNQNRMIKMRGTEFINIYTHYFDSFKKQSKNILNIL